MFLQCYSPEGHKLLLNTGNNSGLIAIEIDKIHGRFNIKTVVELVNFNGEWPNSQLDPHLVAILCRMVVIHSMASYVNRHGRKFVASHFWFFSFQANFCRVAQVTRVGRAQVVGQSLIRRKASRVSRSCITSVSRRSDRGCGSGIRVYADRPTNGLRGSRARKSVVVRSQVTLITLPIISFFVYLYVSRSPISMKTLSGDLMIKV